MSREAVFAAIQSALQSADPASRQSDEQLQRRLQSPAVGVRPAVHSDLEQAFFARLDLVQTSYSRLSSLAKVPGAVADWRHSVGCDAGVAVAPALARLDWSSFTDLCFGPAAADHGTGVSTCLAGIAESGGVVLSGTAETPSTLAFLPENHIVVLKSDQLVRHIEDAWPLLRASNAPLPRSINVNTGPSRTADIEQTLEIGAHGPRRMHVLFVEDTGG